MTQNPEQKADLTQKLFGFIPAEKNVWNKKISNQNFQFRSLKWNNHSELENVTDLIGKVWGMNDRDLIPSHLLSIVPESGGFILLASSEEQKAEGFLLSLASLPQSLIIHMIGVAPEAKYKKDLGWNLLALQSALATENKISDIEFTYDPLRGGNAKLYVEKIRTVPYKYTINKYGAQENDLYKESPTDRLTVHWDLQDPQTIERMVQVHKGQYQYLTESDIDGIKEIDEKSDLSILPDTFKTQIPGDVDKLSEEETIYWRLRLRKVLTSSMLGDPHNEAIKKLYTINGFSTDNKNGELKNFYVLRHL